MNGLFMKLIAGPVVLVVLSLLMPSHFNYPNILFPILIGAVIGVAGYGLEVMFLRHGTVWASTILDFFAAATVVYFSQYATGNNVTFLGAVIAGVLVAITEHFVHLYLINRGKIDSGGQGHR